MSFVAWKISSEYSIIEGVQIDRHRMVALVVIPGLQNSGNIRSYS